MKAAFIQAHGGTEVLQYGEIPTPEPRPDEVRVKLKFSALNHLDIWVRQGIPGIHLPFPHVLGSDGAGIVDKPGTSAQRFKAGEAVIVHPGLSCGKCDRCRDGWESLCSDYKILGENLSGTNAEYVCVPERNLFPKPSKMGFEEASALSLVFTTAWQMLVRRAQLKKGEFVVLHGAGSGVTQAGIQIARVIGAEIAVTSTSKTKLDLARELGAQHLILSTEGDFTKAVKGIRKEGADVIFDHVGQKTWVGNIKCIRSGGRIVICGATSGREGMTDLNHVFFRQIQIQGSTMGSKSDFPTILGHFEKGDFRCPIDRIFPLNQTQVAHTYLADQKQNGKVLLKCES